MSHIGIVISEPGEGPGGTAKGEIVYTPSDDVPWAEVGRRKEKAHRLLKRANGILYNGTDPYPDE